MIALHLIGVYLIAGIIFSIPFLHRWIYHVDEAVHGAHWSFKVAIFPGCVVLWPSLLKKYVDYRKERT